jgi:hypothetical protein
VFDKGLFAAVWRWGEEHVRQCHKDEHDDRVSDYGKDRSVVLLVIIWKRVSVLPGLL